MLMSWPPPPPQLQKIWRSFLEEKPFDVYLVRKFRFIQLFGENLSKCSHFGRKFKMATRGPGPLKYFRVCASDKKYSDPFKVTATTPTGHFFFFGRQISRK